MKVTNVDALRKIANDIRISIIETVYNAKSGHPGGSLSCADILTVLYFNQMNINPEKPNAEGTDRFVISKGHCSPALYSVLARKGYFDKEVQDMSLYESTLLAGIPNAPSVYSPTKNPDLAKQRHAQVLSKMVKYKYITQEEADKILNEM